MSQDLTKLSDIGLLKEYSDTLSVWGQFMYKAKCLQEKGEELEIEILRRINARPNKA